MNPKETPVIRLIKKEFEKMKTIKALKMCAKWLQKCLVLGYKKEQLNILEKLWWDHHGNNGKLVNEKDKE